MDVDGELGGPMSVMSVGGALGGLAGVVGALRSRVASEDASFAFFFGLPRFRFGLLACCVVCTGCSLDVPPAFFFGLPRLRFGSLICWAVWVTGGLGTGGGVL